MRGGVRGERECGSGERERVRGGGGTKVAFLQ